MGIWEPEISSARSDLWTYRWIHAKALVAIRQGKPEEARKLRVRGKPVLGKGLIPDQ